MKKILVSLLAVMVVLSMSVPVFAAPGPGGTEHRYQDDDTVHDPSADKYLEDVTGNNTGAVFNKYLITREGSVVPNIAFEFTIEPGAAQNYDVDGEKFQVLKPTTGALGTANVSAQPIISDFSGTTENKKAQFTDSITKHNTKQGTDNIDLDDKEQYQKVQKVVNFRGVTFYEPGVYRYILKETSVATNPSGMYLDTQEVDTHGTGDPKTLPAVTVPDNAGSKERVLDVYVTDNGSGKLVVSSYVLQEYVSGTPKQPRLDKTGDYGTKESQYAQGTTNKLTNKSDGFVNEYQTVDLDIKKEVKGKQASRDKYFELTVTLDDKVRNDDIFVISVANDNNANTYDGDCDATSGKNAATITANQEKPNYTNSAESPDGSATKPYTVKGSELKAGHKVYLQHGQHIVIRGLPDQASYKVTENSEDYKSIKAEAFTGTDNVANYWNATDPKTDSRFNPLKTTLKERDRISDINGTDPVDPDGLVRTSFLNVRSGIIPTGLLFSIGGGAMIVLLAAAMLVYLNRRKARRYEA